MTKLLVLTLASTLALTACVQNGNEYNKPSNNENIVVEETSLKEQARVNSSIFFVGGEYNGDEYIKQSMVHSLEFENSEKSIVMLPGHGLSAYLYTSTPDGRSGWNSDFANSGYETYAIDTNNLVVSGLEVKNFNTDLEPVFSTYTADKIWKTWGFGLVPNEPYGDTQYPTEYIEQLYASLSPMVKYPISNASSSDEKKGGTSTADPIEVANLIELLEQTGPSVLMVHSMGGVTGFEVVRQRPELVTALVVIEPVGSPTNEIDLIEHFLNIPYLAVYGDYIESRGQTKRYEACQKTAEILNTNGGYGEVITLTDLGYVGNTHLMMQDKNSDEISAIIIEWLNNYSN